MFAAKIIILAIAVVLSAIFSKAQHNITELTDENYLSAYDKQSDLLRKSRPLQQLHKITPPNYPNPTDVNVSVWHGFFRSFDDAEQTLQLSSWFKLEWIDKRLKKSNIDSAHENAALRDKNNIILVALEDVWTPPIRIVQRTYKLSDFWLHSTTITVDPTRGSVMLTGYLIDELDCQAHTRAFPFDTQTCFITLLSVHNVMLKYVTINTEIQAADMVYDEIRRDGWYKTGSWVMAMDGANYDKVYSSVANRTWSPTWQNSVESALEFQVIVARRYEQYIYVWIVPPILLSMSSVVGLYFGCESGERYSFGGAVVVTLTLMQAELRNELAVGVDGYPILGALYMSLTVLLIVATLLTPLPEYVLKHICRKQQDSKKSLIGQWLTLTVARLLLMALILAMQVAIVGVAVLLWYQA